MKEKTSEGKGKSKCNFSHYTLEERHRLLEMVKEGRKAKEIADSLHKDQTSISRELKRGREQTCGNRLVKNRCEKVQSCNKTHICVDMKCRTLCKNCYYSKNCNELCPDFKAKSCSRTTRYPYICDGCDQIKGCTLPHYHYDPEQADQSARTVLVESRRGINMTEATFAELDKCVVQGTRNGQSIEHIMTYADAPVTARTVRNYIAQGILTTKKADTPRGATYKPRQIHVSKEHAAQVRRAKEGRDYAAFLAYAQAQTALFYTQMDTVLGGRQEVSSSRLLTFVFVPCSLFFCMKLNSGRTSEVQQAMDALYSTLGADDYALLFGVILTDNGSEFSCPEDIETDRETGLPRSRVFYCNPYSSWEKGAVEVCHELLRRILPKGSGLHDLQQDDIRLINSHMNSCVRQKNGGQSAYDTFCGVFGERGKSILDKLMIDRVPPEDVCLKPHLLRHGSSPH